MNSYELHTHNDVFAIFCVLILAVNVTEICTGSHCYCACCVLVFVSVTETFAVSNDLIVYIEY